MKRHLSQFRALLSQLIVTALYALTALLLCLLYLIASFVIFCP